MLKWSFSPNCTQRTDGCQGNYGEGREETQPRRKEISFPRSLPVHVNYGHVRSQPTVGH